MPEIAPAPCQTVVEQVDSHQTSVIDELSDWQISVMLGQNSSHQTLLQLQYSDPALPGPHRQKRPAEEEAVAPVRVKQCTQRICKKCHKSDCPGAFKSRPCKYKQVSISVCSSSVEEMTGEMFSQTATGNRHLTHHNNIMRVTLHHMQTHSWCWCPNRKTHLPSHHSEQAPG